MNRDDIIRMAWEARAYPTAQTDGSLWLFSESHLERFAALVAAAEREACAKFIEGEYVRQFEEPWRHNLAAAIRARGEK
jgi:hypothetical protein